MTMIPTPPSRPRIGWTAVLLPLTAFDRGIEAGGAHRHVKADHRDTRHDFGIDAGKNTLHLIGLDQ
jgi:hypothetical protein